MKDYRGPFQPDLQLEALDHDLLARYGRDIMLANHIHDRSALTPVALDYGLDVQTQVACDEWMSTSPIYNHRNRKYLRIEGDTVDVALKSLQVDIGAPHNFLNFHYALVSPREGYFWTSTCGPFNHVHKMTGGDEAMQTQICHHMEDPTFDATVMAVHPQMRCRAVFRPPVAEIPATGPCKWRVSIEDAIGLVEDCPHLAHTSSTLLANFAFEPRADSGDGWADYSGEFKRDFCLEDLSHSALVGLCEEFLLDVCLLNYACHHSVAARQGEAALQPLAQAQYRHLAPVTAHRLQQTFGIEGEGIEAVLKVLQLNYFTPRGYTDLGFAQTGPDRGLVWLNPCAAVDEPVKRGLVSLLVASPEAPGFDHLAQAVNPHAVVRPVSAASAKAAGAGDAVVCAWEVVIDPGSPPAQVSEWADHTGDGMWDLDNSRHGYRYQLYDEAGT